MRELEYSLTLHSTLQAIAVQLFHRFGRKSDRLIFAVVCDLRVASHRAQISWIWRSRVSDRAVAFVMTWRSGQPFVVARSLYYAHRPGPDGQGCSHLGPGQLGSTGVALGVFIIARPLESVAVFALVIAIWALIDGLTGIVHAFDVRPFVSQWWLMLLSGLISFAFGLFALYDYPVLSLVFAVVWVSWWLVLSAEWLIGDRAPCLARNAPLGGRRRGVRLRPWPRVYWWLRRGGSSACRFGWRLHVRRRLFDRF